MDTPYYREGLGYVQDSETSQEAADSFTDDELTCLNALVVAYCIARGKHGSTCDEGEVELGLRHQTLSSRFTWLTNSSGHLVRTKEKRRTRSGRYAFVYVAKAFAK